MEMMLDEGMLCLGGRDVKNLRIYVHRIKHSFESLCTSN
jgi:hypothetical protein